MESTNCNLCESARWQTLAHRDGMTVVQCENCGLVFVNPRMDAAELERHYNTGQSSRIQYYLDAEEADRRTFEEILDIMQDLVPLGKLLDVGPNIGTFMVIARQRGWDPYGVEINVEAARYCVEKRALAVEAGVLKESTYQENFFEAVHMGDVIEHLRDPLATMRTVHRILRPGGIVAISTPDISQWAGRILQLKPKEHLYYFTPATMDALLEKACFELIYAKSYDRFHNISAMTYSTTFGDRLKLLKPGFATLRRLFGDIIVKLPIRENLLAVARKPVQVSANTAQGDAR